MPVTLISSNAAWGRAERLPGVAVAVGWRDGAPTAGSRARSLTAWLRRRGVGSDRKRSVFGWERDWSSPGASRAGEAVVVLVGARYLGPGVFRAALREALEQGDIRRPSGSTFTARESHRDHENGGE